MECVLFVPVSYESCHVSSSRRMVPPVSADYAEEMTGDEEASVCVV